MATNAMRWIGFAAVLAIIGCDLPVKEMPSKTDFVRLPEHGGLATRYPGDKGLAIDPAVVFADDFESVATGALPDVWAAEQPATSKNRWSRGFGGPRITDDPEHVHAGHRALDLTIDGPAAIGLEKHMSPGYDRLFLRNHVKYDEAFPGAHHVGGMMSARAPGAPEATPGVKPDGTNKFDVSLDHGPSIRRCHRQGTW
jgi:hypothetical protein